MHAINDKPGFFFLLSPLNGIVLTPNFQEEMTGRVFKPSDQILRVGNKEGNWEIELKIPQKHIGQVLQAFKSTEPIDLDEELDVDLILRSAPTSTFKAKLARRSIGGEATPNRDDNNEAEPIVLAYVRIDGPGIDPAKSLAEKKVLLVPGTEVVAKIRCGDHAMGYSLFYGVWEFIYEKVVFFF